MVSNHPKDAENGYCGNCHRFIPGEITDLVNRLVVNAITGTNGSFKFKEQEIRQRLVPRLFKAVERFLAETGGET